jgi:hypothetical protein
MRLDQTEYHKATVKGGGGARTAEAICRSTCRKLKCVGGEDKKMSREWSVVKKQERPEFSSPSLYYKNGTWSEDHGPNRWSVHEVAYKEKEKLLEG